MKWILNWLDDRIGYRRLLDETLNEPVPGGARWRYVWGSTLVFTFALQAFTGFLLWCAYSPSAQTAWESVYYIQNEMYLGNVVRGIHHFAAQMMIVLLALHLIQVIVDGAYRAPREVNFWTGLILAQIVLALSLTGYLLPWDQKGFYATQVSTNIIGAVPVVGMQLQQVVQGGPEYGHHTLTRFFAMHAGLLPALLVFFLVFHLYVFRRNGVTAPDPERAPTVTFWPEQVLRDSVACLGVLAVVLLLAIWKGAELSAPADASEPFSAARPEWYFLSLFQFLRFEAVESYGMAFSAIYVPGAILGLIVLMPIIALIKGGHQFNVVFMAVLALAAGGLTLLSIVEDRNDVGYQAAVAEADRDAQRVLELAQRPSKIPVEGAGALLRRDPFTQGPRLFAKHCASCHRWNGHNGRGQPVIDVGGQLSAPTALDLAQFASRDWWTRILTDYEELVQPVAGSDYDLETSADEGMISWFRENEDVLRDDANKADIAAMVEYLVAQSGREDLEIDEQLAERGEELVSSGELTSGSISTCDNCHVEVGGSFVLGTDNGGVPELNEYGSAEWLSALINDPESDQFFGEKNKMPSFANKMSPRELDLLVRYMRGDYPVSMITDDSASNAQPSSSEPVGQ